MPVKIEPPPSPPTFPSAPSPTTLPKKRTRLTKNYHISSSSSSSSSSPKPKKARRMKTEPDAKLADPTPPSTLPNSITPKSGKNTKQEPGISTSPILPTTPKTQIKKETIQKEPDLSFGPDPDDSSDGSSGPETPLFPSLSPQPARTIKPDPDPPNKSKYPTLTTTSSKPVKGQGRKKAIGTGRGNRTGGAVIPWTESEDRVLLSMRQEQPPSPWSQIALSLPGRSIAGIQQHWNKEVKYSDPSEEGLNEAEEKALQQAVKDLDTGRDRWWFVAARYEDIRKGKGGMRTLGKWGAKRWVGAIAKAGNE